MIHHLRGTLVELMPQRLVLEVGAVGYEIHCPAGTFELGHELGSEFKVLIHHHQTEAAQTLYGFSRPEQRDLFRLLIERVSGVGPKMALAVLGGMAIDEFRRCVIEGDAKALSQIKGIGLKTAQRILLELTDKIGLDRAWGNASGTQTALPEALRTTVLALLALGYKQAAADRAARAVLKTSPEADEAQLLRAALRELR